MVIIGGGILGCSIAYYLSRHPTPPRITIIEKSGIACAASGKAGGFLSRDWGSGPTVQLHEKSFDLHCELAEQFNLQSFRRIDARSLTKSASSDCDTWLNGAVETRPLSDNSVAAQVNPCELTVRLAKESGCTVLIDTALGVEVRSKSQLQGLEIDCKHNNIAAAADVSRFPARWGEPPKLQTRDLRPLPGGYGSGSGTLAKWIQTHLDSDILAGTSAGASAGAADAKYVVKTEASGGVPCDKLVIACGPWSGVLVEDWFGVACPIDGIKSTSLIYENALPLPLATPHQAAAAAAATATDKKPFVCFSEEDARFGTHLEIYPRPNGDIYVCGCGGSDVVSGDRLKAGGDCYDPTQILADPVRAQAAAACFRTYSTIGCSHPQPSVTQACMRPCPPDGLPIMGRVSISGGAVLGAGARGDVRVKTERAERDTDRDRQGDTDCYNEEDIFVCAGHNCWGILWAPICGKTMADLVLNSTAGVRTQPAVVDIDMHPFRLERFQ